MRPAAVQIVDAGLIASLPFRVFFKQVLAVQMEAKARGFSDVLYLDAVSDTYLEEVSSCNIFVVKVRWLLCALCTCSTVGVSYDGAYSCWTQC